jgi:hypothetical protein
LEGAGDPDLYGYCLDDPVNGVDPTGLQEEAVDPEQRSWAYKYLRPPLLKPKGDPDRDAAERQMNRALKEWGGVMMNGGHWAGGVIQECAEANATLGCVPKGIVNSVAPGLLDLWE